MHRAIETAIRGDKATAHGMFEYVASLRASDPEVWVWLGGTSDTLDEAESAFRRAREIDPSNEKATLGLRWVVLRRQAEQVVAVPPVPVRPARSLEPPVSPQQEEEAATRKGLFSGVTSNVFVLSVVSFLTDIAGGMLLPLRMLFLVVVLQTPLALAGLIEGIAIATASLVSIFADRLPGKSGDHKRLLVFGYSLSSLARPLLFFAGNWAAALGLIFLDRAGRGVRSVPRDELMSGTAPQTGIEGTFRFHRRLNSLGALVGPLLAYLILFLTYDDLRAVLAWTALPGLLAVVILVLFLRERGIVHPAPVPQAVSLRKEDARKLGRRFWMFTALSMIFALGSSTEAFIFLRTADLTDSVLLVPLIYFGFIVVYVLLSGPLGAWSDRFGRLPMLIFGYGAFALIYLGWAIAVDSWAAWALFLLYGVYAAATEGVARAFVADIVPREARATALGWFSMLVGIVALPANIIAGWLWSMGGPSATFTYGAWLAAVSVTLGLAWLPWLRSRIDPETRYASTEVSPGAGVAQV